MKKISPTLYNRLQRGRIKHLEHIIGEAPGKIPINQIATLLSIPPGLAHYWIRNCDQINPSDQARLDASFKVKEDTFFDMIARQMKWYQAKYGLCWNDDFSTYGMRYKKRKMAR